MAAGVVVIWLVLAVRAGASEHCESQSGGHLFSRHQAKLIAHLCYENFATVDRELAPRNRAVDERRRPRAVDEIDDDGVAIQTFEPERSFVRVAADGRCVNDDIVTFCVEIEQRFVW